MATYRIILFPWWVHYLHVFSHLQPIDISIKITPRTLILWVYSKEGRKLSYFYCPRKSHSSQCRDNMEQSCPPCGPLLVQKETRGCCNAQCFHGLPCFHNLRMPLYPFSEKAHWHPCVGMCGLIIIQEMHSLPFIQVCQHKLGLGVTACLHSPDCEAFFPPFKQFALNLSIYVNSPKALKHIFPVIVSQHCLLQSEMLHIQD